NGKRLFSDSPCPSGALVRRVPAPAAPASGWDMERAKKHIDAMYRERRAREQAEARENENRENEDRVPEIKQEEFIIFPPPPPPPPRHRSR
ncbi:MAG: hypothetical protein LBD67_05305, partial [Candidatus Accumulibacter sp.]|nr:hypothetical protein [Accumulibacter sp.]